MVIRYKKNGRSACYDSEMHSKSSERCAPEQIVGPFESCLGCPYAGHGFICYYSDGDCLRTIMQKLNQNSVRKAENYV